MTQHAERDALRAYTLGSLCSGIGGIDLAFEIAGFHTAWQIEIEPDCRAVLAKHWPDVPRYEDLTLAATYDLTTVDVVAGGIPCQPFSSAGKQRGKADNRYLWPQTFQLIQRLDPRFVFLENVPGIIKLALDTVLSDLENAGYTVWTFDIPACAVGAVHIRERIFILAYRQSSGYGNRCRLATAENAAQEQNDGTGLAGGYPAISIPDYDTAQPVYAQDKVQTGRYAIDARSPASVAQGDAQHSRRTRGAQQGHEHAATGSVPGAFLSFPDPARLQNGQGLARETWSTVTRDGARRNTTQSRLVRDVHGLSGGLDFFADRWPAPFGATQKDYEPPRTVSGYRGRARRIKALGNAVVPQVVYPFAAAIHSVLTEQDSRSGAE